MIFLFFISTFYFIKLALLNQRYTKPYSTLVIQVRYKSVYNPSDRSRKV